MEPSLVFKTETKYLGHGNLKQMYEKTVFVLYQLKIDESIMFT